MNLGGPFQLKLFCDSVVSVNIPKSNQTTVLCIVRIFFLAFLP